MEGGAEFISKMLDYIAANIAEKQEKSEKDYVNPDGLLVCGTCGTRKQTRINVPNIGEKVLPVGCKCQIEKAEAAQRKQRAYELDEIRRRYIEFDNCRKYRFEQDDGRNANITGALRRYVDKFDEMLKENTGILLHGGVGTGKTFYVGCIANELIDRGYSVVMTSISIIAENTDVLSKDRTRREEYIEHLKKCECLILDDLAAERDTEYMNEKVYNVINMRYQSRKPLIITTNASKRDIIEPNNIQRMRIYERLIEMCALVEVSGETRRIEKANQLNSRFEKRFFSDLRGGGA